MLNEAFIGKAGGIQKPTPVFSLTGIKIEDTVFIKKPGWAVLALTIIIVPFVLYRLQADVPDAPLKSSAITTSIKPEVALLKTALDEKEAANPL